MTSLSFKMVYYIMMDLCMYLTTLFDSKYSKPSMVIVVSHLYCKQLWIQQNHGTIFSKLLVATTLEICEGVCEVT
jgi:hypothetical protein